MSEAMMLIVFNIFFKFMKNTHSVLCIQHMENVKTPLPLKRAPPMERRSKYKQILIIVDFQ